MQPGHDSVSGFNLGDGKLRGGRAWLQLEQELGSTLVVLYSTLKVVGKLTRMKGMP